jgi:hypothetical protein
MTDPASPSAAPEPRIRCVCGRSVLPKNWENHTLGEYRTHHYGGAHVPFVPVDSLTDEEALLLQRLDLLEADRDRMKTLGGRMLRSRIVNRLTALAERPAS